MDTNKQIQKTLTREEMLENAKNLKLPVDPDVVIEAAIKDLQAKRLQSEPKDPLYKVMSMKGFENGMFLNLVMPEHLKTFAIHLSRQLQQEFKCEKISEKSVAELVAINYCRTLEIQRRINNLLSKDGLTRIDLEFFSLLSKELDRANRHYLSANQILKLIKQPQFNLNIKTDTTILGNNQLIQENRT